MVILRQQAICIYIQFCFKHCSRPLHTSTLIDVIHDITVCSYISDKLTFFKTNADLKYVVVFDDPFIDPYWFALRSSLMNIHTHIHIYICLQSSRTIPLKKFPISNKWRFYVSYSVKRINRNSKKRLWMTAILDCSLMWICQRPTLEDEEKQ